LFKTINTIKKASYKLLKFESGGFSLLFNGTPLEGFNPTYFENSSIPMRQYTRINIDIITVKDSISSDVKVFTIVSSSYLNLCQTLASFKTLKILKALKVIKICMFYNFAPNVIPSSMTEIRTIVASNLLCESSKYPLIPKTYSFMKNSRIKNIVKIRFKISRTLASV